MLKRKIVPPVTASSAAKKKQKQKHKQAKKERSNHSSHTRPVVPKEILNISDLESRRDSLHASNENAFPFPHLVLDPLCQESSLRAIMKECAEMTFTFKESDLFKVYQSSDLSNLSESSASKVPNLFKLREELYSERYRALISQVMGVGNLTDKTDMSINIYAQSCHLICHDDVVATRSVAYIIYLTDPDDAWDARADGGALELYALDEAHPAPQKKSKSKSKKEAEQEQEQEPPQGIPMATPCASIPPKFNTLAMFRIQAGRSYHSVQEVYAPDKTRLSISGWFHTAGTPPGSDQDHLLKIANLGEDSRDVFTVAKHAPDEKYANSLSPAEAKELSAWINPIYLTQDVISQLHDTFVEQECIQLHKFLSNAVITDLARAVRCESDTPTVHADYERGVGGGWAVKGPAHKQRYLVLPPSTDSKVYNPSTPCTADNFSSLIGGMLSKIRGDLLLLPSFMRYLSLLTGQCPAQLLSEIRRFRPGLDYSIAHMGMLSARDHLDFSMCFVDVAAPASAPAAGKKTSKKQKANSKTLAEWQSGDLGGFVSYVKADETLTADSVRAVEADEVFNSTAAAAARAAGSDDDEEEEEEEEEEDIDEGLTTLEPGFNVLSIVLRRKNQMHFVKYVNSSAGSSSRWDIAVEAEIQ
jgi:Rps23 Pro-64 3,4-dihydroxylase Tpa1-like proline 4-hydroxylase